MRHGHEILTAIRSLIDFHEDVASLLRVAESQLAQKGWTELLDYPLAVAGVSMRIDNARSWMPLGAFRFLANKDQPGILAFVSVILDDADNPTAISEPLFTAGWIVYQGADVKKRKCCHARAHLHMPGRKESGKWLHADKAELPESWRDDVKAAVTMAIPLGKVTGSTVLQRRITQPLAERLRREASGVVRKTTEEDR